MGAPPPGFALPAAVLVRAVPSSYDRCLRENSQPPDIAQARREHAGYVAALRETGAAVIELPAEDTLPDSCFVEDCVVVLGQRAMLTRPGAPSRRPEVSGIADAVGGRLATIRMEAPACLDGGDVLRVEGRLFVGLSARTNEDGAARLAAEAAVDGLEIVRVPVEGALHLKSLCSLAAPGVLVVREGALDPRPFVAAGLMVLPVGEAHGANVLFLGEIVLVSADAPGTAAMLSARGMRVRVVKVSEFHKGDGALTCLSVRIPAGGAWVT